MAASETPPEKKLKMTHDFFGKAGKTIVMNKINSLRNGSGSTSADITKTILHHYWNSDATTVWSNRELAKAAGDTSQLQPLLEPGHRQLPGWRELSCETRTVKGGALFRIFDHAPSLSLPRCYAPKAADCVCESLPGLPPGVLYAVVGVAANHRSAKTVWQWLRDASAPLYAAEEAGFGMLNGHFVASACHSSLRRPCPTKVPWVSLMAYSPVLHEHQLYYPDDINIVWPIAKQWFDASRALNATADQGKEAA